MYNRDDLIKTLKENVCVVTFTKVNGEKRVMTCTLREDYLPPLVEGKQKKKQNDAVLSVWDTNKKAWRAFRVENVEDVSLYEEKWG